MMGIYCSSNKLSRESLPLFLQKQTLQESSATNNRIRDDTGNRANRSQRALCKAEPLQRGAYGHRRSSRLQTITLTSRADSWTEEHESVESHNDGKKNVGSMFDKNRQLAKRNTTLLARWYDADRK